MSFSKHDCNCGHFCDTNKSECIFSIWLQGLIKPCLEPLTSFSIVHANPKVSDSENKTYLLFFFFSSATSTIQYQLNGLNPSQCRCGSNLLLTAFLLASSKSYSIQWQINMRNTTTFLFQHILRRHTVFILYDHSLDGSCFIYWQLAR